MKRFWKAADVVERDGGWGVELDGKPLRTPARHPLTAPTKALADAVADQPLDVLNFLSGFPERRYG